MIYIWPFLCVWALIVSPAQCCNDILANLPLFGVTGDSGWPQLQPAPTWHCRSSEILGQGPGGPSVPLEGTDRLLACPLAHPALQNHPGLREGGGHTNCQNHQEHNSEQLPCLTPETLGIQLWILLVHVILIKTPYFCFPGLKSWYPSFIKYGKYSSTMSKGVFPCI